MNLLTNIDEEYKKIKNDGRIGFDENYHHYRKIKFNNSYSSNAFWCLKQKKMKFIIEEEIDKIKLYLTDADIIDLIIKLDEEYYNMIIKSFYNLYIESGQEFLFSVSDINYTTLGLKFTDKERLKFNKQIETKADFCINFEDLVNLVNLIIAKEKYAMELAHAPSFNRVKRQLAKFISLANFYKYNDDVSKKYLQKIGYKISATEIYSVYSINDWNQSKIDIKFNNNEEFEKLFIK
ncbi:hypothetical protein LIT25_05015 [Bacillus sp. F19]|nr:hypothetical protein LIT25_05015 [Bacillus sp. F19]